VVGAAILVQNVVPVDRLECKRKLAPMKILPSVGVSLSDSERNCSRLCQERCRNVRRLRHDNGHSAMHWTWADLLIGVQPHAAAEQRVGFVTFYT
jgi:hypothetical protein